jgi:predicted transposase YbfD/YdcC
LSKKTLNAIIESRSHFLIQVKGNTSKLYSQVKHITTENELIDTHYSLNKNSGRADNRLVEVYEVLDGQITNGWLGIKRVIKVYRWDDANPIEKTRARKSKNNTSNSSNGIHYYILSKSINSAAFLGDKIRDHWLIENKLHWSKDVYLKEDFMTIIHESASALVAALNNLAMNQIRKYGVKPNKDFFTRIKNNISELFEILRT